jgi:acyl-[acyl-carrier-protein]-phospholipid O-acyltransferase / long-chain-fatty-acid--[acyl-carrier-protein] ligase
LLFDYGSSELMTRSMIFCGLVFRENCCFVHRRMTEEIDRGERKPAWGSFWALIGMQVQNSFTVSIVKFLLIPLGAWLALQDQGGFMAKHTEHVVSLLLVLPYLLFSPFAGWIGDRFPKSKVIKTAAIMQWGIVMLLIAAIWLRSLNLGFVCFFLYSMQCCLLSPAKLGVVKELVGSRRLSFATGVVEGTVILAILAGQIAGGIWFDHNFHASHDGWNSALTALFWIAAIAFAGALAAQLIHGTRAQSDVPFRKELLFRHIKDSKVAWSDKELRISVLGTAFFWAFAGFVNLVVIEIAKQTSTHDLGTAISKLMFFASLGIALGSIFAGLLSKRGIEWSLAPIGLFLTSVGLFVLSTLDTHSVVLPYFLSFAGAGAAMFLVPVNTFVQDHPPAEKRGTVIAVSNFFNNLGGITAVLIQLMMVLAGMHVQWQFLLLAILTMGIAILAANKWLPELLRVILLPIVRLIYRLRVIGHEHVPEKGGVLLLPNHVTWADAFFVSAALHRPVRFVMFDGFMKTKGVGWFARLFDTVPISAGRAKDAVRLVSEALQAGDVVCLFAEGELTRTGCLQEIKRGFELMARRADAPVIPLWMEGAWGSVFSFERGCFFKKVPYSLPYPMTMVLGEPLPAQTVTAEMLRHALQRASATALSRRAEKLRNSMGDDAARWINGLQIAQVNALPRQQEFCAWEHDPMAQELASIHTGFASQFHCKVSVDASDVLRAANRMGGAATRQMLAEAGDDVEAGAFYDFEYEPVKLSEKIVHCPCYARDGIVIAMSMPDPPLGVATSHVQPGSREGSVGLLLPGFHVETSAGEVMTVHGPALPKEGIVLPAGSALDDRGFLRIVANES